MEIETFVCVFYPTSPIRNICQTPDLGPGLGVDFTFPNNDNKNKNNKKKNKKKNKNPHLIFHRREGTRGLKFGTQIKLTIISIG